jgi:glycogen debranching enzyme
MSQKDKNYFWDLGKQAILALETETGILASGRDELYGCIFGRDSLITALKLLRIEKRRAPPSSCLWCAKFCSTS